MLYIHHRERHWGDISKFQRRRSGTVLLEQLLSGLAALMTIVALAARVSVAAVAGVLCVVVLLPWRTFGPDFERSSLMLVGWPL